MTKKLSSFSEIEYSTEHGKNVGMLSDCSRLEELEKNSNKPDLVKPQSASEQNSSPSENNMDDESTRNNQAGV